MDDGTQKLVASGPRTRVCYICGRQYGLSSYDIHLKQCKELFLAREAKKDPRERKKLPEDPLLALSGSPSRTAEQPKSAMKTAKESSGGGDIDLDELNRLATATFNSETLETCKFCGRTFLAEKLLIHNRSCTIDNPARRVSESVKKGLKDPVVLAPPRTAPAGTRRVKMNRSVKNSEDVDGNVDDNDFDEEINFARTEVSQQDDRASGEVDGEGSLSMATTVNLQIQNGVMAVVGHLGGSGGRTLRNQKQLEQSLPSTSSILAASLTQKKATNTSIVSAFQDKQEVIEYLAENISFMENTALGLMHSISEMKDLLKELSAQK